MTQRELRWRRAPAKLLLATVLATGAGACAAGYDPKQAVNATAHVRACPRPYSSRSPWNSAIPRNAAVASDSAQLVATITQPLTSDPSQYAYPVYVTGARQATVPVHIENIASIVTSPNRLRRTAAGLDVRVPLPPGAQPSSGGDHQVVVWNQATGDEWGFWLFNNASDRLTANVSPGTGAERMPLPVQNAYADYWTGGQVIIGWGTPRAEVARVSDLPNSGHMILTHGTKYAHRAGERVWGVGASNGYRYNTKWSGVPPSGFSSRGAGVTYLAGLVRSCEIAQGHIDHALAFVYPNTTSQFVYPARKSDGQQTSGAGLPEGARLQLDPSVRDGVIKNAWHCRGACFTIAKALQRYGMYLIDTGGHPKIIVEDGMTAHWHGSLTADTVSSIPTRYLRLIG